MIYYFTEINEEAQPCQRNIPMYSPPSPSGASPTRIGSNWLPREGSGLTEETLRKFCMERIAKHKVPRYFRFVDSFPMNAAGKILKYKMREEAVELLKLQDADKIVTA